MRRDDHPNTTRFTGPGLWAPAAGALLSAMASAGDLPPADSINARLSPLAARQGLASRGAGIYVVDQAAAGDARWNVLRALGRDEYLARWRGPGAAPAPAVAPVDRLHPIVTGGARHEPRLATVVFAPDVDALGEGLEIVRGAGARVIGVSSLGNALVVRLSGDSLHALALGDEVLWIEPAPAPMDDANDGVRALTQADIVQNAAYGLTGAGVRAMVFDSGVGDASHADFGGRLTPRDEAPIRQHSTHVAGTLGGSGALSSGQYAGVAPGVVIESYGVEIGSDTLDPDGNPLFLYTDPGDFEADYYEAIVVHGVDLASNSLSTNVSQNNFNCDLEGDYALMSAILDGAVRGSLGRPIPIVWANGNERGGVARCGSGYFTTPPPVTAKNVIAVGAVDSDNDAVASFSSWGPTDDGRLRPDLVAPGTQITGDLGVTSTNQTVFGPYYVTSGTSMATPAVSGAIAILLEDFRDANPAAPTPTPSMFKAILLHTASDIAPAGPDYQTGYGSLRIADAVDHLRTGQFIEATLTSAGVYSCWIDVPPDAPAVKATLAWDDAPGAPLAPSALVNNLDLRLYSPTNVEHFPWTLDPLNPALAAVRTQSDDRNNVEQVFVEHPQPGRWRIDVRGTDVPVGPQRFALTADPGMTAIAIDLVDGPPESVPPGVSSPVTVRVRTVNDSLAGAPTLHARVGSGSFTSTAMTLAGDGLWTGALPPAPCLSPPEFFVVAPGVSTGTVTEPPSAPVIVHAPVVAETTIFFDDDFESNLGWVIGDAADTASAGVWTRVDPRGSRAQPEYDRTPDGDRCYVTGQNPAGASPNNGDVDGGRTTLTSPPIALPSNANARISYWRWFSNITGASPQQDVLRVQININGGPWVEVETVGPAGPDSVAGWRRHDFAVRDFVTLPGDVRLRFIAEDAPPDSAVEAAIDDVLVYAEACASTFCPGDANGDGTVDFADLNIVIGQFNTSGPGLDGDVNGDGAVDFADLNMVLSAFNLPCF